MVQQILVTQVDDQFMAYYEGQQWFVSGHPKNMEQALRGAARDLEMKRRKAQHEQEETD